MRLSLHRRRRGLFAVFGALLPLLFLVALGVRWAVRQPDAVSPESSLVETITFTATGHDWDDLFMKSPVRVRLWRDHVSGVLAVGLGPSTDFLRPDVMVYWSVALPTTNDTLPPEAKLLGALIATTLVLPAEASSREGYLILFSVAHQAIVDVSRPTRFIDSMKQPSG